VVHSSGPFEDPLLVSKSAMLRAARETEVHDMSSKVFIKRGVSGEFSTFRTSKDGGMAVDREKLHQSAGYKRQVDALVELSRQMRSKKK